MFKHAFSTKASNKLRSSEWRGLKSRVQYAFPELVSLLDTGALWERQSSTSNPITCEKIIFNSEKFVGSLFWIEPPEDVEASPFLLAMEPQEGILLPSLVSCWKVPQCVPVVCTIQPVMDKICQGADLMAPGIIENMPKFKEGSVVGVALAETPELVMAIGIAQMSSNQIMADRQGKAIKIIHSLGDRLWIRCGRPKPKLEPIMQSNNDELIDDAQNVLPGSVGSLAGSVDQLAESMASVSVVDPLSEENILETFTIKLMEMELPVSASTLHSKYLTPQLPGLDFKKTSWKSVTKFLKFLEKKKLITLKERQGDLLLTGFNSAHDMFDNVILPKKKKNTKVAGSNEIMTKQSKERPAPTKNLPGVTEVFAEAIYKNQPAQLAIFGGRSGFVGTFDEASDAILAYLKEKNLISDDGRSVRLDDAKLCTVLHLKPLGTGAAPSISLDEVIKGITSGMKVMHRFSHRTNEIISGPFQKVKATTLVRQKRRVLTEIVNLGPLCPLEECQATFSVKCASSVSIDGDKLYIQGNHIRYLRFWAAENGFMKLIEFSE